MRFFKIIDTVFNIIVYGIIIAIAVCLLNSGYKFVKKEYQKFVKRKEYRNKILIKYQKFSNTEKAEIYNRLIDLKKSYADGEIASKKARETRGDAQMNHLIKALTPNMVKETIEKDYSIDLVINYIEDDIDYLKQYDKEK